MKFTCSTTSLNKAIQTVQRAISSKPTAPIFSGIHIIAAEKYFICAGHGLKYGNFLYCRKQYRSQR